MRGTRGGECQRMTPRSLAKDRMELPLSTMGKLWEEQILGKEGSLFWTPPECLVSRRIFLSSSYRSRLQM